MKIGAAIAMSMLGIFAGSVSGCSSETSDNPGHDSTKAVGTVGGSCYPNSTCNEGLVCLSDLCVDAGTGGTGGGPDASIGGSGGISGASGQDSGQGAGAGSAGTAGAGGGAGESGAAGAGYSDYSPIDDPDCTGDCGSAALPYGAVVGTYRGVQAYSNGNTWDCHACADGTALGLACASRCGYTPVTPFGAAYQCVEYIRRFYGTVYDDQSVGSSHGNAKDYITKLPSIGFTCYANGQSDTPPQPDDIVVFTGGGFGHIAIARAVSANSLTLIHQNARHDASDEYYTISMTEAGGKFTVGSPPSPLSNYSVAVWCRNPSHDWTKCSTTLPCPDGYDCVGGTCSHATACPGGGNCSGHGVCDSATGTCTCTPPFNGLDCATATCPGGGNCSGHGSCDTSTGACTCTAPYQLPDCSTASCPNDCSGHGTCNTSTGTCSCTAPYQPPDCSSATCPGSPACSNHGTCNTSTGTCSCTAPYQPPDCSSATCPGTPACSNHGTCDTSTGTCTCTAPYQPPDCSTCTSNCTNKCGGASDECGGYCNDSCGTSQWCVSQSCTNCSFSVDPASGYTPSFTPLSSCTCTNSEPTCHALYQGRILSKSGWHADLEFTKANGTTINAGTQYWVVVGDQYPSCTLLGAYTNAANVRASGTVSSTGLTLTISGVPIWKDQASYDTDAPGVTKNIFLITDGSTTPGVATWFQKQALTFTKTCP